MKPETIRWEGCYGEKWGKLLDAESAKHPAKFSRGLVERIIQHGFEIGAWSKSSRIADPFGGVASAGVLCALSGLCWIGVELEALFVSIAERNIARHRNASLLSGGFAHIIHGDSRKFCELVQSAAAVVCSPPYGDISAGSGGLNHKPAKAAGQQSGRSSDTPSQDADEKYGRSVGQIARLPRGDVDSVITSPPWLNNVAGHIGADRLKNPAEFALNMANHKGHYASAEARLAQFERGRDMHYGNSDGQVGRERGSTYWESVAVIYASCYKAIRPGGSMVVVVKNFVRQKKIVALDDDTLKLLLAVGFELMNVFHARLVEDQTEPGLFGEIKIRRQRKSFWARLHESRGGPAIDHETVLWMRKP